MKRIFLISIILYSFWNVGAQQTQLFVSDIYSYRLGLEYYNKQLFSAAQKEFEKAIKEINNPNAEVGIQAEYYAALCAVELFHRDASLRLRDFIRSHPESPRVLLAKFRLGLFYYRKSEWKDVVVWLEQVDPLDLDEAMRYERNFKLGYAYFQTGELEMASTRFFELKDISNPYATPARYYFAHIAYQNEKFETAYSDFKKLEGDATFGNLVPYYLSQILHQQKKFDELLDYATPLLDSVNEKRRSEMARLLGDAWYNKGNYEAALPLLEQYHKQAQNLNNDDRYQLAFSYFKTGDCENAAPIFGRLISLQNEMAQLAAYHLGECYRMKGEKTYARNAYMQACSLAFDDEIREDALFNAAVMGYGAAADPFGKAAKAFEDFITAYPLSPRVDDAYSYLTAIYLTSNNFDAALQSVERMKRKTPEVKLAYQQVAFNRGVELYQNRNYEQARNYFERSQTYPENAELNARTQFWIGETWFRQQEPLKAAEIYKSFQYLPSAILTPHFHEANYNIAYCYFIQEDYKESVTWFRKFIYRKDEADSLRINDALLRTGDAYFVMKQYDYSLDFYQKAGEMKSVDADYALFQQAICLGIAKKYKNRETILHRLTSEYPMSAYYEPALYELGRTRALLNQPDQAQLAYAKCIQEGNNALYIKKSLIASGLLYYNRGDTENALAIFHRVIKDYPNYEDTREALKVLKAVYIERGDVDRYSQIVGGLSFAKVTDSELDSAVFDAAELHYMEGSCNNALKELEQYLDRFRPAQFETRARAYLADCAFRNNMPEKAMVHYSILAGDSSGNYAETANLRMSELLYEKEPAEAYVYFKALYRLATTAENRRTALLGQLDCLYRTNKRKSYSILANEALNASINDNYYNGLAYLFVGTDHHIAGNSALALLYLDSASKITKSEVSAESRYQAARIYFGLDSMKKAELLVFELVNQVPSYGDWIARGLILLSEIYLATDKVFQAKAALQSVLDNYEGETLRNQASKMLSDIENQERKATEKAANPPSDPIEIVLPGEEDKDLIDYDEIDSLFEEEAVGDVITPENNTKNEQP